jgi:hypothetical protein
MAKVNKTGRSKGGERFVQLPHWLLGSTAWQSLGCEARSLYIELKRLFMGANNGNLYLSLRTAAEALGVGKSTVSRAFNQLVDRGFVRSKAVGSFNWKQGTATKWVLTEYDLGEQTATKDFMRWQPPELSSQRDTSGRPLRLPKAKHGPATGTVCPPSGTPVPPQGQSGGELSSQRDTSGRPLRLPKAKHGPATGTVCPPSGTPVPPQGQSGGELSSQRDTSGDFAPKTVPVAGHIYVPGGVGSGSKPPAPNTSNKNRAQRKVAPRAKSSPIEARPGTLAWHANRLAELTSQDSGEIYTALTDIARELQAKNASFAMSKACIGRGVELAAQHREKWDLGDPLPAVRAYALDAYFSGGEL